MIRLCLHHIKVLDVSESDIISRWISKEFNFMFTKIKVKINPKIINPTMFM